MTTPAADDGLVLTELSQGVLLVTWNRPDRLNAWTPELEERYFDLLDEADTSPDVRVIVVTGAGRGFCAGVDMAALRVRSEHGRPRVREHRPLHHPLSIRKPIIAAINGGCAGVGLCQALYCDIRFAVDGAKITSAFARRGIVAEYGASWLLRELMGAGRTADFLLSGRVVSGEEAATMGLVNASFPDVDALMSGTLEYAHSMAAHCSPSAMALIKRQISDDRTRTFEASEAEARAIMAEPDLIPDFREGVAAFSERRPPIFQSLPVQGAAAPPIPAPAPAR